MSKQMLELADRLAGSLQPFDFLTREERDLVVSVLRCSAVSDSDGEHELIDRLLAYADNCSADGMAQAESDLRAACDCIIGGKSAINRLKAQVRTGPQASADSATSINQIRAFADEYAGHRENCESEIWHGKGPLHCSCGYYEALARILTAPQASAVSVPVNMPFERLPQHAGDPGFGPVPDVVPLHPSTEPQTVDTTEALRKQAFALSCHEQFRLASFVAENLGYVLSPDPLRGGPAEPPQCQAGSAPQPSSGHGCKRAGGFIDSGCTALCDCHITLALSRPLRADEPAISSHERGTP